MWGHAVALLLLHARLVLYGLNACFVEAQERLGQARLAMAQAGFFAARTDAMQRIFPALSLGNNPIFLVVFIVR